MRFPNKTLNNSRLASASASESCGDVVLAIQADMRARHDRAHLVQAALLGLALGALIALALFV